MYGLLYIRLYIDLRELFIMALLDNYHDSSCIIVNFKQNSGYFFRNLYDSSNYGNSFNYCSIEDELIINIICRNCVYHFYSTWNCSIYTLKLGIFIPYLIIIVNYPSFTNLFLRCFSNIFSLFVFHCGKKLLSR